MMLERVRGASLMLALPFAFLLTTIAETRAEEACAAEQAKRVQIGAQTFHISVAASPSERALGLSGRTFLPMESGLWFVFPAPDWYGFWMREMNFPIDLIWIDAQRHVVNAITLQPCTAKNCPIHYAPKPVAYVLEINSGNFAGQAGDQVTWRCSP